MDQRRQPFGVLRQPLGRLPAQRIKVARLRGDEFARQAQFAIGAGQPRFQSRGFGFEPGGGIGKARCLAPAAAHYQQPQHCHQHHRLRPKAHPSGSLRRAGAQNFGLIGPDEPAGPAADQQQPQCRRKQRGQAAAGARRIVPIFCPAIGIVVLRRRPGLCSGRGGARGLRGRGLGTIQRDDLAVSRHGKPLACAAR